MYMSQIKSVFFFFTHRNNTITSDTAACSVWHSHSWHCREALTRKRCWFRRHRPHTPCFSGTGSPWRSASSHRLWFVGSDLDSPARSSRCWPARRRTRLWRTCRLRWSRPRCSSSTRAWSWLHPGVSPPSEPLIDPFCGLIIPRLCSRVLSSASAPPKWLSASWGGRRNERYFLDKERRLTWKSRPTVVIAPEHNQAQHSTAHYRHACKDVLPRLLMTLPTYVSRKTSVASLSVSAMANRRTEP